MYNQHTRGMATTRHKSLLDRGGRKALLETLHTQKKNVRKNPIFTNLKKRFEHIELPAKLLDYFLRSNKSNINQSIGNPNVLWGWVNANWAGDSGTRILMMNGGPISWKSRHQDNESLSTSECEFVAASQAGQETIYLRETFTYSGFSQSKATLLSKEMLL